MEFCSDSGRSRWRTIETARHETGTDLGHRRCRRRTDRRPDTFRPRSAMTAAILVTLACRAVHPPAISTALTFAFRPGEADKWIIFMAALAIIAMLVVLQPLTASGATDRGLQLPHQVPEADRVMLLVRMMPVGRLIEREARRGGVGLCTIEKLACPRSFHDARPNAAQRRSCDLGRQLTALALAACRSHRPRTNC